MATHFRSVEPDAQPASILEPGADSSCATPSNSAPASHCWSADSRKIPDPLAPLPIPPASANGPHLDKAQVLAALEHICASAAFHGSRRCQQFLRFIVLEALRGHAEGLKERIIATEVFGRGLNFEPGEDSLVRVKARELRKRLEAFYETDAELTCRIEIPLGGYAPRFQTISRPAPAEPQPLVTVPSAEDAQAVTASAAPTLWTRRRLLWSAAVLGGTAVGAGVGWQQFHAPSGNLESLWRPVFRTKTPLVVFIPVLKDRDSQEVSDRVGIGPAQALRKVGDFLDAHHYPYHLRFGSEMNYAVLKEQPSLLLGGFSSTWTALMTRGLRFTMLWDQQNQKRAIVDSATGKSWLSLNPTSEGYADTDYGLFTRLFDHATGQISMIAGGLTTFGTEAAAEILTISADLDQVLKAAPKGWQQMNFQVVVQTSIIGTTPSHPQIVAVHFW